VGQDAKEDGMGFGAFGGLGILITLGSLAFTGVMLVFAFVVVSRTFGGMRAQAQLAATGTPAQGRVMGVRDLGGSVRIGGQLPQQRLQIDLEVYPQNGQPYRTTVTQLISMLHMAQLQPGATVRVACDPSNPMRVALVM
jgi:hypothetical protein